jgi:alpha-amylase
MTSPRRWLVVGLGLAACARPAAPPGAGDFAWTRGATCYEVFVRSFADSDGDGIGDLNGLTARLDYVNDGDSTTTTDLGASCLWLMPVAESPSYHGYDVSDYYRVEPDYGTADDFKRLVAEAHRRGIEVLVDMVLNHTSDQLPAFQAALRDTASPYRSWYRFAPEPLGKGPWGMDAWHKSPVRDEYYYGVFWKGMPDLDYHTPAVREEAKQIATYWLTEMGVDGFRLDAVPYLMEDGDCQLGCEGTHAFLREYAAHLQSVRPGTYTVGEVWGGVDTLLPYYPDQLTSYFTFSLSDSLIASLRRGFATDLLGGFLRLQDTLPPYRWSPFLRNHDQTRTLTTVGGDWASARLGAVILLTLPGLPFVYYGEEIGMTGDKPDERLRTPMQWRAEPGLGFTSGRPWEAAQPDSFATTVAAQDGDPGSLLNLYRRLIHLRKAEPALGIGRLVPLATGDSSVVAYLRRADDELVLVVANLASGASGALAVRAPLEVLGPGRYQTRNLMDRSRGNLQVDEAGRLGGVTGSGILAPKASVVLVLTRADGQRR